MGAGFDSGLLLLGESFKLVVGASGEVAFQDSVAPASSGILLIDPKAGQKDVFLPFMLR